jgi:hypothetical protein
MRAAASHRSMAGLARDAAIVIASICAASAIAWTAIAQRTVDTSDLAMTGWRTGANTAETAPLGMTGWRTETEAATIDTATLGMTGWHTGPVVIDTAMLGMTGWRGGVRPRSGERPSRRGKIGNR